MRSVRLFGGCPFFFGGGGKRGGRGSFYSGGEGKKEILLKKLIKKRIAFIYLLVWLWLLLLFCRGLCCQWRPVMKTKDV